MCGIFGSLGGRVNLLAGLNAIKHRGPDAIGHWEDSALGIWLGHVRLSILDLSALGNQPMISKSGRTIMVFNGEIYNYIELRKELEKNGIFCKGRSDSEVLLEQFEYYGNEVFNKLNGIYSVAFWDRNIAKLTLARDPLAVKPLYYYNRSGALYFASEIKALFHAGAIVPAINPGAVYKSLCYLWTPGAETFFNNVYKLLPGEILEFQSNKLISKNRISTENVNDYTNSDLPIAEAVKQVGSQVDAAVKRQMVSDVEVGSFLSGGLDSSAVSYFAQKFLNSSGQRLNCFTIEHQNGSKCKSLDLNEDLPYAKQVAKLIGANLQIVTTSPSIFSDVLERSIYMMDEPVSDPAVINTLLISELAASNGLKVLLSGAGGDDIFSGYRRHFAISYEAYWSNFPKDVINFCKFSAKLVLPYSEFLRRLGKALEYSDLDFNHRLISYFFWLPPDTAFNLFTPEFKSTICSESVYDPLLQSLGDFPMESSPLRQMLFLERQHFLADHNLNYTDKMGMAAGIEIRVPLLDIKLVNFASKLPDKFKQNGTVGKWIFKKAMEPYFPKNIIYRKKVGFGSPLKNWIKGPLNELVNDTLSPHRIKMRGLFKPEAISKLIADNRDGKIDASYSILLLVSIELWSREFLDKGYDSQILPA
jgi:asparagine synthase (glutamine-hydrolysing)